MVDVSDGLRVDQQLCAALYAASRAMTASYRGRLEPLGLTYPQYLVMLALWERDGRSVGELGMALALDSGTLSPLLKRMEAAGLVQRRRTVSDERRVHVTLTDAGRALREQAVDIPKQIGTATGLSLDEIAALRNTLQRLTETLNTE
jgi:MarR family transcriptional regulator, organic hydroperoxide resistance regulator